MVQKARKSSTLVQTPKWTATTVTRHRASVDRLDTGVPMVPAAFSGLLRITMKGESDPLQNMGNHTLHGHPGWCAKSRTREMVPETIAEHCAMALSLVHAHSLRNALICVGVLGGKVLV